ncbi:hypothetical protein Ahy_A03g014401 [Arachis hypogaea]|uniref:Replication factor A C-terminal domain-containing protein n=1 Tax=Arachis hypogaea TaxID=3818 RepID=A0A445DXK7_ARAHY|nr:hypothetical protein Ahy_A03g014401 [Arachis hypogaea]
MELVVLDKDPTKHNIRIIFKRDTLVLSVEDTDIPIESFNFLPMKDILSSVRDDLFLIDFIGLLSAKSDLIPFEKKEKKSHYMKIELDDLRLIGLGGKHSSDVDVIGQVIRHSSTEDFLSLTPYASICQIKQTVEKLIYTTCGTAIDIDRNHAWWYKACRQCPQGLESLTVQFYCAKCDVYASTFVGRFCIQVRVVDDSHTATFVLYKNSDSNFLGVSTADIRCDMLAKAALQEVAITPVDRNDEAVGTGDIGGVTGSIIPLISKATTICAVDSEPMVTHTLVK